MSKKMPSFPLYPQDFIASLDVQMMSAEDIGIFFLLLINSWIQDEQCFLPDDEKTLAFISRIPIDRWKKVSPKILKKFKKKDGKIYNERLLSEKKDYEDYRKRQSDNGKKGGRPYKIQPIPTAKIKENQKNPPLDLTKAKKSPSPSPSPSPSLTKAYPKKTLSEIAFENEFCDQGYLDKMKEQIPRCKKENIENIKRKTEVMRNCVIGGKIGKAKIIFHEIAGLINDSQQQKLSEI